MQAKSILSSILDVIEITLVAALLSGGVGAICYFLGQLCQAYGGAK